MENPKWFDYNVYMANKLFQMKTTDPGGNWTPLKLLQAFSDAGFIDHEGAYQHFLQYGADEDVSPNAFFNAAEYYQSKAMEYFDITNPKDVTVLQAVRMQVAIHEAGMNAWTHYERYGTAEGVNPSNKFDTSAYMAAKLAALQAVDPTWTDV